MKDSYLTEEYFLDQIINKALSIVQILYPGYELLFIFNNRISHFIYIKVELQVANINKKPGN